MNEQPVNKQQGSGACELQIVAESATPAVSEQFINQVYGIASGSDPFSP